MIQHNPTVETTRPDGAVARAASARRDTSRIRVFGTGALCGALIVLLGLVVTSYLGPGPGEKGETSLWSVLSPRELRAELGVGRYEFFPNRQNVWVVNRENGRLVHFRFIDTEKGTVERSHVAQIDLTQFPPEDTYIVLSERNITGLLWVANKRTGDFQLWRRNVRDGRLVTDPNVVPAAQQLMAPPLPPTTPGDSRG